MNAPEMIAPYEQVPVRFTADEFMELVQHPPVNGWTGKIELIEGEIVRISPAHVPHWNAQRLAILNLQSAFASLGDEWIVGGEAPVRLGNLTVRVPDVAVLRAPDLKATVFDRSALFMVVEVADTSLRNDLGRKLRAYAASMIPHYWVIDLRGRRVLVHEQPLDTHYRQERSFRFGEPIPVPGTGATIVIA